MASQSCSRRGAFAACAVALLVASLPPTLGARDTLPSSLSNKEFWALIEAISEPGGYFRSNSGSTDNLLSNENAVSRVSASIAGLVTSSGVYLGVGPEQNFSYIAAVRPRIAFITDIRRGNLHLHLLYKALFELSADRADFVARLFGRTRPEGLTTASSARTLMSAYLRAAPVDEATFAANLKAVTDHLTKARDLPLDADDRAGIEYMYRNFNRFGPGIGYTSSSGGGSSSNSYAVIMSTTDARGMERTYLANESNFALVKTLESKNLLVPVVGDFAGPKALRAIGRYLRDHGAVVAAFYVSNVEMYLQRNGVWAAFCANVAALPLDASSLFVRPDLSRFGATSAFSGMAAETAGCAGR